MAETNANDDTKSRILEAATRIFSQKGYTRSSVREIASAAGVTTGSLYHHYRDKEDLLLDVIKHHIHYVHTLYIDDTSNEPKPSDDLLRDILFATGDRLKNDERQRLQVMLAAEAVSSPADKREKHRKVYEETIQRTAGLFDDALGVPNDDRKLYVSSILIAALDGMAVQTSLGVYDGKRDELADAFNDFFVKSIRAYLSGKLD